MVSPIGAGSSLQASCYLSRQPMGLGGNPPSAVRSAPAGLGQMAATLCGGCMCPKYIQLSKNSLIEQQQRQTHWFMDRLRLRSSFHRLRKRSRSRQPSPMDTLQTGPLLQPQPFTVAQLLPVARSCMLRLVGRQRPARVVPTCLSL